MPNNSITINGSEGPQWDVPDSRMEELVEALNRLGNPRSAIRLLTPGEVVLLRRRRMGLTLADLASRAKVSKRTLQRMEANELPRMDVLKKVANTLGIPCLSIVAGENLEDCDLISPSDEVTLATFQLRALDGKLDAHSVVGRTSSGELVEAGGCPGPGLCEVDGCDHAGVLQGIKDRLLQTYEELQGAMEMPVVVKIVKGELFLDLDQTALACPEEA